MSENFAEKRKSIRVPVNFSASFSKDNHQYHGTVLNLSVDGLFIKTQQSFDTQDILQFSIQLPGSEKHLHAAGRIMWGTGIQGEDGRYYGMGIHFENLSIADGAELHSYIQKLLQR